jgi:hypothetical protein
MTECILLIGDSHGYLVKSRLQVAGHPGEEKTSGSDRECVGGGNIQHRSCAGLTDVLA